MELRHRILEYNNSPKFDLLRSELLKLGCEFKFNDNSTHSWIEYLFSNNAHVAPRLKDFAASNDIRIQSALYYEEEEILNAEWVMAEVGEFQYPQPEKNFMESTYDLHDYCKRCGQGAKQNKPFRLKKDFTQKNTKFLGLHWVFEEIFIRPEIKRIFDSSGISGITYLDVIHQKTDQRIENVLQMNIPVIETKGLITDSLFSVTCKPNNEEGWGKRFDRLGLPYCRRVKYHYPLTLPIEFKASVLKDQPDFIKSNEYFGSMAGADHLILARNKVVRLVKEKGLRGLGFHRPVHLV